MTTNFGFKVSEEDPCHIGWYKIYYITTKLQLGVHHFDIKKGSGSKSRMGGLIYFNEEWDNEKILEV